ncbi:MAG: disulfide bond formation protein DsbA [Alkalinema sp. CACIAM 70d]|nr:MAG: disulfide bond formation protein DsbA [Alkalinema sp. CACIAM 70d]
MVKNSWLGKNSWVKKNWVSRKTAIAGLLAVCIALFSCSKVPVQAETKIDPQFEQQVLEVLRKHPEVILESVRKYQQDQAKQAQQAQQALLDQLKTNPKAAIGSSPTLGAPLGKVVLFEFSDFQCPYCAGVIPTLKEFVKKYPDKVTLVYKHFPLSSIHLEAVNAAKAAWAAQQQGKFWEYHDALFAQQKSLNSATYSAIATSLKLDLAKFERDRTSAAAAAAVAKDQALGDQLGIDGTPFFIMNGQAFSGGVPLAELEKRMNQGQ